MGPICVYSKMELASRTRHSFLPFIFVLYFFQGILYGLQVKYLPIDLRTRGFSLSFIGSLNLAVLPWLAKSLWAPLVDVLGTTLTWLRISLVGIAMSLALLHFTREGNHLLAVLLLCNVFSATHELVIAKLLLTTLRDTDDNKTASSLKVVCYKSGSLFGGGVALSISNLLGITNHVFLIISTSYCLLLLLTMFCIPENYFEQPEETDSRDRKLALTLKPEASVKRLSVYKLGYVFNQMFANVSRDSKWMVTCLLVYKYASHSSHMLFTMALVDQGVKVASVGLMSGVVGHVISILAAVLVGVVLSNKRFSAFKILHFVSFLDMISVFLHIKIVCNQTTHISTSSVFFSFCLQHVVLGAQATPMFSLMLTFSQEERGKYQVTKHSVYCTLETLGSQLSLLVAGLLAEYLGYRAALSVSLVVSVAVVCMVGQGPDEENVERRENNGDVKKKANKN